MQNTATQKNILRPRGFIKIKHTIEKCETSQHLEATGRMIENYFDTIHPHGTILLTKRKEELLAHHKDLNEMLVDKETELKNKGK